MFIDPSHMRFPGRVYCLALTLFQLFHPGFLPGQNRFQNPTILDYRQGLPSNDVTDIVQDQNGFIWIATTRGIVRYDGLDLQNINSLTADSMSLPQCRINDILVARKTGALWISSNLGLFVYQPNTRTLQAYVPVPGDNRSLPHLHIDYTYQDREGVIWAGAFDRGVARYQPDSDDFLRLLPETFFPPDTARQAVAVNRVQGFLQDADLDHIYWLSTAYGLLKWDRHQELMVRFPLDVPHSRKSLPALNSARCMYQHPGGWILQGLWEGGFSIFNPRENTFRFSGEWRAHHEFLNDNSVHQIQPRFGTEVWLSFRDRLAVFDLDEMQFTRWWGGDPHDRQTYGVDLTDREGRIWTGFDRGVNLYDSLAQQLSHYVLPVRRGEGGFYFSQLLSLGEESYLLGFGDAPAVYEVNVRTGSYRPILPAQSYSTQPSKWHCIDILKQSSGEILVLTSDRLLRLDAARGLLREAFTTWPWQDPVFSDLLEDAEGNLWLTTRNEGLFRFDAQARSWRQFRRELEPPGFSGHSDWLGSLHEGPLGRIWFRASQGYSVYLPDRDTILNFPFREGDDHNFISVTDFATGQDGMLWVGGGEQGVGMIDPSHPEGGITLITGPEKGLRINPVNDLTVGPEGKIWLVDGEALARFDPKTDEVYYLDPSYGLPGYDEVLNVQALSSSLLVNLPGGRIGLGYRRGFAVFEPSRLRKNHHLPIPYIRDFQIFDRKMELDTALFHRQEIRLGHRENFFSFELSALNFFAPEGTVFRYRLEGVDEDWVDAGARRYVAYTNVSGGHYTLRVMAGNNEGRWNLNPYVLSILVATPWWQTQWFYALLLFFGAGLVYLFYRWRVWQIRSQENLKSTFERQLAATEMSALRAQMNPHFIFNCLNSIDYFIIQNKTEEASDYLNRFSRLIRLILQNSRAARISLQDELDALRLYIELESLRFQEAFDYVVKVDEELDLGSIDVPPMLLQPYVENAIWHGLLHKEGKGRLELILSHRADALHCVIRDNGIGRAAAKQLKSKSATRRKSFGMQITRDRLKMLGHLDDGTASVEVHDLTAESGESLGTVVELVIGMDSLGTKPVAGPPGDVGTG